MQYAANVPNDHAKERAGPYSKVLTSLLRLHPPLTKLWVVTKKMGLPIQAVKIMFKSF